MRKILGLCVLTAAAGCADLTGAKDFHTDIENASGATDVAAQENDARMSLGRIETALSDFVKKENKAPDDLDALIPNYIAELPPVDITVCGKRREGVQKYPGDLLRDGQIDGSRIKGTGLWGYVHDQQRAVVFVDCMKPSADGTPWYQVRGVY